MAIKEIQENFQEIITQEKDVVVEVNCHTDPIPDLYSYEASLKMVWMEPDRDVEDSHAGQRPLIDIDLK